MRLPSRRATWRSPTGVSTTPMPAPAQRAAQPEVRHHRHHDRVVAQHAARVQVERGHRHDLVAVDQLAVLVDRDHPVGVAVEREPERRRRASTTARCSALGMRRAAAVVDVAAVGRGVQHVDLGARARATRAAPTSNAGAVRAVEHDVAARRACGRRARRRRCATYASSAAGAASDDALDVGRPARVGRRSSASSLELGLDRGLDVVGQLAAVGADELHAVVGPRVVARRDRSRPARPRAAATNAIAGVGSTPSEHRRRRPRRASPAARAASMRGPGRAGVAADEERASAPSTRADGAPERDDERGR